MNNLKLFDVIEVIGGGTPKRNVTDYWNGDIDWLSVKDFNADGRYVHSANEKITTLGLNKSSTKMLAVGDLIISARGTVGCLAQLTKPMAFNQSCYGIRGKENLDNDFLFYFLKTKITELQKNSHGAVFDTITTNTFKILSINLPLLDEQKAIASVLGALDDKIENNRQMNETLEEMAHAIFKSWFLDFDPVHAKVTGNAPAHMDADTAALFPSSFGDEGLPMGWSLKAIEEIGDVITGKTPSTKHTEYFGNEYPFIKIPNMNSVWVSETEILLSKAGHQTQAKKLLPKGAVLVSCIASVGAVSIAKKPSHTNQQVNAVIPTKGCPTSWMYCALVSLRTEIIGMASGGSVTPNLNKGDFSRIKVICSSNLLIVSFDKIVGPLFDKILSNDEENQTLAELRDTLLPKLMSGEIRVTDAEREVEAAV